MFISNVKFYVKSTISSTQGVGTTFKISEDFETNTHIETGSNNVSIVLKNATQIERMTVTATGGVATIIKRGLTQADTKVENVSYQKQWNDGTIGYVTAFASDLLDTDSANNTLNANMTYEGNNTFNGNVLLNKGFRVPEFDNATERDTKIPTPEDGMLCYLQDVEDYYSYKNGIWTKGLGGSGGSVTWYQDSTDDGTITGTIDGINTTFNLSNTPAQPQAVILTYNGQTLDYGSDYTIVGRVITMILVPVSGKLTAIYPDTPVGTGSADARVTSNTDAHNGELFRNSGDSNNLYYKDNGGDNIKIIDVTTNKIVGTNIDYSGVDLSAANIATDTAPGVVEKATDAEVIARTDTARYITPKQSGLFNASAGTIDFNQTHGATVTITLGFKPILINFHTESGMLFDSSTFSGSGRSSGTLTVKSDGTLYNNCEWSGQQAGQPAVGRGSSSSYVVMLAIGGNTIRASVTSVSTTGFTITFTRVSTNLNSQSGTIQYNAIG